jgi:putative sugar O-methyltransferase
MENKHNENEIFDYILSEIQYIQSKKSIHDTNDLWANRVNTSLKKFLNDDNSLRINIIRNFRRNQVFVTETPPIKFRLPINWISGSLRGAKRFCKDRLNVLIETGDIEYLKKYPINFVGNPYYYKIHGYLFNERWTRHVRYTRLLSNCLNDFIKSGEARVLDIGSSYGIFPELVKREFINAKIGIIEFSEQLLLAYYYLKMSFPSARINTLREVYEAEEIDLNFVNKFDFTLIPVECYNKLKANSFNLITNFASFGEMSKQWFETYLDGEVFRNARYFFTLNRFESRPTYNTDINILDYRLHEYKKIYFQISPLFHSYYEKFLLFFYKKKNFTSQSFEFIGKK